MPKMICICGPNGAGKSSLSRMIAMRENLLVIDPDQLDADGLSPIQAGKETARLTRFFMDNRISFVRESTLTSQFDFKVMEEAKRKGYEVDLVYIRLATPELAVERVKKRRLRGGHSVPEKDILRRFHRSLKNLTKAKKLADRTIVLDNSSDFYRRLE